MVSCNLKDKQFLFFGGGTRWWCNSPPPTLPRTPTLQQWSKHFHKKYKDSNLLVEGMGGSKNPSNFMQQGQKIRAANIILLAKAWTGSSINNGKQPYNIQFYFNIIYYMNIQQTNNFPIFFNNSFKLSCLLNCCFSQNPQPEQFKLHHER